MGIKKSMQSNLKERFLHLRTVEEKSFRDIEKELGVSAKTLVEWSKEFQETIDISTTMAKEELAKKFKFTVTEKQKILSRLYEKYFNELEARDLSTLPTDKLLNGLLLLEAKLNAPTYFKIDDFYSEKQFIEF